MMRKLDGFMGKLSFAASSLAAVWLFLVMLFVCGDVVFRLFLNDPLVGTPEIVQNSLAAIAFLMLPWATFMGQHVRSTMIRDKVPRKWGYALDIMALGLGTALFLGIAYACLSPALRATRIRDFQGEGFRVPIYPVWWVIIFGATLSGYQCLSKVVRAFLLMVGKPHVESIREHGGIQI